MKNKKDSSPRPFPFAAEEQKRSERASIGSAKPRRGFETTATWLVVGAAVVMITGAMLNWFDYRALGWLPIVVLVVCFGAFAVIALLSFRGVRKG